jgi:hypothetical protein
MSRSETFAERGARASSRLIDLRTRSLIVGVAASIGIGLGGLAKIALEALLGL